MTKRIQTENNGTSSCVGNNGYKDYLVHLVILSPDGQKVLLCKPNEQCIYHHLPNKIVSAPLADPHNAIAAAKGEIISTHVNFYGEIVHGYNGKPLRHSEIHLPKLTPNIEVFVYESYPGWEPDDNAVFVSEFGPDLLPEHTLILKSISRIVDEQEIPVGFPTWVPILN